MAPAWPLLEGQSSEVLSKGHMKWDFSRPNPLVVSDPSHLGLWHGTEAVWTGVAGLYTRGRTCLPAHSQNVIVIVIDNTILLLLSFMAMK